MTNDTNTNDPGARLERVDTVPLGTFKGQNFVTPELVAFYRRELRGRTAYVEISKGEGLSGKMIFGVTFRWPGGERIAASAANDPSACCDSLADAMTLARTAR